MWHIYILSVSYWICYGTFVLQWNERRKNLREIEDPLFQYFPRFDASWPVMIMINGSIALFLICWSSWDTLELCWTYNVLVTCRIIVLYLHPFRGHRDIIPLRDVLLERVQRVSKPLQNDLSFSGHVSTLVMFGFVLPELQWFFWSSAFLSAILMLCARAHYAADCALAPPFVFFAHRTHNIVAHIWYTTVPHWVTASLIGIFLGLIYLDYYNKKKRENGPYQQQRGERGRRGQSPQRDHRRRAHVDHADSNRLIDDRCCNCSCHD